MGDVTRGVIVRCHFPYADASERKARPCLVLTDPSRTGECIVCMITSRPSLVNEHSVRIEENDILKGYLPKDSQIRPDKVYTASAASLRPLATLLPKRTRGVLDRLRKMLE